MRERVLAIEDHRQDHYLTTLPIEKPINSETHAAVIERNSQGAPEENRP